MTRGTLAWLALGTVALGSACRPAGLERADQPPGPNGVQVRFLGVGGFLIRKGPDVVMTAPLYTSPLAATLLARRLDGATDAPAQYFLEHRITADTAAIEAILVGHAHYDHLMDVPFFVDRAPHATVYGSTSVRNVLAGYGASYAQRTDALNDPGNDRVDSRNCRGPIPGPGCGIWPGTAGAWVPVPGSSGRVRIRALCSSHPPQVLKSVHFWPGCVTTPLAARPSDPQQMREGEVLAFLIDFLEQGQVRFRLYFQDAPVSEPTGWAPRDVIAERDVDVALLCAGTFDAVDQPEKIVRNLEAHAAILHHWENFFDPFHRDLTPITDIDRFRAAVIRELGGDARRVHVLVPGAAVGF